MARFPFSVAAILVGCAVLPTFAEPPLPPPPGDLPPLPEELPLPEGVPDPHRIEVAGMWIRTAREEVPVVDPFAVPDLTEAERRAIDLELGVFREVVRRDLESAGAAPGDLGRLVEEAVAERRVALEEARMRERTPRGENRPTEERTVVRAEGRLARPGGMPLACRLVHLPTGEFLGVAPPRPEGEDRFEAVFRPVLHDFPSGRYEVVVDRLGASPQRFPFRVGGSGEGWREAFRARDALLEFLDAGDRIQGALVRHLDLLDAGRGDGADRAARERIERMNWVAWGADRREDLDRQFARIREGRLDPDPRVRAFWEAAAGAHDAQWHGFQAAFGDAAPQAIRVQRRIRKPPRVEFDTAAAGLAALREGMDAGEPTAERLAADLAEAERAGEMLLAGPPDLGVVRATAARLFAIGLRYGDPAWEDPDGGFPGAAEAWRDLWEGWIDREQDVSGVAPDPAAASRFDAALADLRAILD